MPDLSITAGHPDPAVPARHVWPAEARHLCAVRATVRHWLAGFDLTDDVTHDIVLAVSEAASNTIDHAYGPAGADDTIELSLWSEPRAVCIEIADRGVWRSAGTHSAGRGLGLAMMRRLVGAVLIHCGPGGTRVSLRHPRPA